MFLFSTCLVDYVVQGHRFDILEDIGCYPVVYNTLPAYFIYYMWPVLLGAVSFVFSGGLFLYLNCKQNTEIFSSFDTPFLLGPTRPIQSTNNL